MEEELLLKKFRCNKCAVFLKDVKLLKTHYWEVHISKEDIYDDTLPTESITLKPSIQIDKLKDSRKRKHSVSTNFSNKRRNESVEESDFDEDDSLNDVDNILDEDPALTEYEQKIETLNKLSKEEIRKYNWAEGVDETKLIEKFKALDDSENFNKMRELKNNKVVWAYWRVKGQTLMWPACIHRLEYNKSNNITKVWIRYFEQNHTKSLRFKMPPNKVELFFQPIDAHIKNKEIATEDKKRRYEFFSAYSDALEEFNRLLETDLVMTGHSTSTTDASRFKKSGFNSSEKDKFFVLDKMLSKEEVLKVAEAEFSSEHCDNSQKRKEYSQNLLDILKSDECQAYIIGILDNSVQSKRHTRYVEGSLKDRKLMKFSSPGPLISYHQEALAENLESLQKTHSSQITIHFKNYVYDVLYPEAVVWAIGKLEDCTPKKADTIYLKGFEQTDEELRKQRCNEIVVNMNLKTAVKSNCNILEESSLDLTRISADSRGNGSIISEVECSNLIPEKSDEKMEDISLSIEPNIETKTESEYSTDAKKITDETNKRND